MVLYLVNASEAPEDAGYLDAEMRVLELAGKPVIVLLNQLGPPQEPELEAAEVERWRKRTAGPSPCVREVLALDAFARCWVQEGTLLEAVSAVLPTSSVPRWSACKPPGGRAGRPRGSLRGRAGRTPCRAAQDREQVPSPGWWASSRRSAPRSACVAKARERRASRRWARWRSGSTRHPRLDRAADPAPRPDGRGDRPGAHAAGRALLGAAALERRQGGGLGRRGDGRAGRAQGRHRQRRPHDGRRPAGRRRAGRAGRGRLARGYNTLRGVEVPTLAWADPVLDELARSALLGYLAVAHYGRGRGDWHAWEHPEFWQDSVNDVVAQRAERCTISGTNGSR